MFRGFFNQHVIAFFLFLKFFRGVQPIIVVTLAKNNPEKIVFVLPKNECIRIVWIVAINRKEVSLPQNAYLCFDNFEKAFFDKSWALKAQLCYILCTKKRKLVDGPTPTVI